MDEETFVVKDGGSEAPSSAGQYREDRQRLAQQERTLQNVALSK